MRTALLALLSLGCMAAAALAQAPAPALSGQAAVSQSQAALNTPVKTTKRVRNGKARAQPVAERRAERKDTPSDVHDSLTSCLAMWDPATHMTRTEWARACRRVAERLRDTKLK
jgi:microsomal dipeptidase-like Zn-dependent dipeptidase